MFYNFFNSIKSMFEGLFIVFSHLFKTPVTEEYPEKRQVLNKFFRGKHKLDNCIACGYCQRVCPADAINITKYENKLEKYEIDLGKCIFCGNCMYYCPTKSISMGHDYELATPYKAKLLYEIENKKRF